LFISILLWFGFFEKAAVQASLSASNPALAKHSSRGGAAAPDISCQEFSNHEK
jgi:hypothetical protein